MGRKGFTLIELLVAVVMLAIVLLGTSRFVGQFLRKTRDATLSTVAAELANERLRMIAADPGYGQLDSVWTATETGFPGYASLRRVTDIVRVTGNTPRRDYTVVTVRVTDTTMTRPVTATITVARP